VTECAAGADADIGESSWMQPPRRRRPNSA